MANRITFGIAHLSHNKTSPHFWIYQSSLDLSFLSHLILMVSSTSLLSEPHATFSVHPCQSAARASRCPDPLSRLASVSCESGPMTQRSAQVKHRSRDLHNVDIGYE